jgi:hypothetical protein
LIYLKLILVGISLAGAVFFTFNYVHTMKENKVLKEALKAEKVTIEKLDEKALSEEAIIKNEEYLLKGIRNAPKSDNAPVAPVLDDLIDHIDSMQHSGSN